MIDRPARPRRHRSRDRDRRGHRTLQDLGAAWVLLLLGGLIPYAQPLSPETAVEVLQDLPYFEGFGADPRRNALDLYRLRGAEAAPVLLFVHGGGWTSGDKGTYGYLGNAFASQGYVTVIPNYRLSPEVQHPVHVRDVARAVAWTYNRIADYGGDPERIVLMGHSAGGHLVALLALDDRYLREQGLSPRILDGVIPISGVYDLNAVPGFAEVFGNDPERRRDASPLTYAREGDPPPFPFLILYAQYDIPTLGHQAQVFYRALLAQGADADLSEVPDRDHGSIVAFLGRREDPATQLVVTFLRKTLPLPERRKGGSP